ncbi:TLC domain-containing protein 1 [Mactra antiquata]
MDIALEDGVFNPYEYEGSPDVDVVYGYLATALSFLMFTVINYVAIHIGPPKNYKGDTWRWRNTFVSWIHADIIGVWVLYCLLFRSEVFSADLILYCDYYIYTVPAISLGYFMYDFLDHVYNGKVISNYEVILHHVGVMWTFGYNIQHRVNIPYSLIALMVEVNSIFLHARKLMQFDQWPFDHWLYRMVVGLNLITFVRFRIWTVILIGLGLYKEWHRLTLAYHVFGSITMFIMYLINPILFWRLFKNDVLRSCIQHRKSDHKHANGINGVNGKVPELNGDCHKQP